MSLWPALRSGYSKQGDQALHDVVEVEVAPDPLSFAERLLRLTVFVCDKCSPVRKIFPADNKETVFGKE